MAQNTETAAATAMTTVEFPKTSDAYELLNQVGVSRRAAVYKATVISNGSTVAIKILNAGQIVKNSSVESQPMISHRNIMTPYCSFYGAEDRLWIVMPFVSHGSLQDVVDEKFPKGLKQDYTASVVSQILAGLNLVHGMGFVHGGVKPSNVFFDSDCTVLLSDFNVCEDVDKSSVSSMEYWVSPEAEYGQASDIWCLGILAMEFYAGVPPVQGSMFAPSQVRELGKRFQYSLSLSLNMKEKSKTWKVDESLKSFVAECLNNDPLARPSAAALLEHPFVATAAALPFSFKSIPRNIVEIGARFQEQRERIEQLMKKEETAEDKDQVILDFRGWKYNNFLFEIEPLPTSVATPVEKRVRFV